MSVQEIDTQNIIGYLIGDNTQQGLIYENQDDYLKILKELHNNKTFPYTENLLDPKFLLVSYLNGIYYYQVNLKPYSIVNNGENDQYIIEGFENNIDYIGGIVIGEMQEDNRILWTPDTVISKKSLTGGKRKSTKRKLVKRKSIKRKSIKRKSTKRKSVKIKSTKRKSIKRKSRKSVYMTKKKCKSLLSKQIKKNSKKYSNHKQAIAIAYSQIKRKHKNCKKHFK